MFGCQQKKETPKKVVEKPIEKNLSEKIEDAHQKNTF